MKQPTKHASGASQNLALFAAAIAVSGTAFGVVSVLAWRGQLGSTAAVLFLLSGVAFYFARKSAPQSSLPRLDTAAKSLLTVVGIMALLRHPIAVDEHTHIPIYEAILAYVGEVNGRTFIAFALLAMLVKFLGVIASAYGWHLLLVGQGIRFPFWSQTVTAFLIGRFIGTFLPSTIGLDGYTLYEASHYSNQWSRVATAKGLEKIIGLTGLFFGMALTLPFGYAVIQDVTTQLGRPGTAFTLAAAIGTIAAGIPLCVFVSLAQPAILGGVFVLLRRVAPGVAGGPIANVEGALRAYQGKLGLLLQVFLAKFAAHFSTASVYYFTALAIGVAGARFWPITFGSTVQILATLLSPTIAGEGAREAFQALLLSRQLGGVAQAVLSAALGFIAAEAATMWGGVFLYTRTPDRRPRYVLVDGKQVDYAWLTRQSG